MTHTTWKAVAFSGAVGVLALGTLAGCSATGTVHASSQNVPTATVTVSAGAGSGSGAGGALGASSSPSDGSSGTSNSSGAGSSDGSGGSGGSGSLRSGQCVAANLQGSLQVAAGGASAGHTGYDLVLRNTTASPCTLQGWPGVSLVGHGNGTQLGAAATFAQQSPHGTVTLAPGAVAHATVLVADAQNFGSGCGITTADGFRVYPPGSKDSLFISAGKLHLSACTNKQDKVLQVQAVQPGA